MKRKRRPCQTTVRTPTKRDLPSENKKSKCNPKDGQQSELTEQLATNKQPSWLVRTLSKIHESYTAHTTTTRFKFDNNMDAAKHNTRILEAAEFDIQRAIDMDGRSIIKPGTEFSPGKSPSSL